MSVTIHRGTHEIGGTCIEVDCGSERIILDLGMPLMSRDGGELDKKKLKKPSVANGILPDISGLYKTDKPSVAAVILSHPHMDHYGLMDNVHPDIPIYLSAEAKAVIDVGNVFYSSAQQQTAMVRHCREYQHWKPFAIGSFAITPYLMDHSAFGSSTLLIEAEGKRILYSGDVRAHGRKSEVFERFIRNPPKNIDCLLLEGTTLGGKHNIGYDTEQDVEEGFVNILQQQNAITYVTAAGSNIDRTVSLYKACQRTGKTMVIDLYQAWFLEQLKKFAPGLPPHKGDHLKVFYIHHHCTRMVEKLGKESLYRYTNRKIGRDELIANRQNMVLRLPLPRMRKMATEISKKHGSDVAGTFVYSMWSGYLKSDPTFEAFVDDFGLSMTSIHTSGHAYTPDLQRLARALDPKVLLPVHTLSGDDFGKYFENVKRLGDGETFVL